MEKIKTYLKELIYPFTLIILLGVLFSIIIYFLLDFVIDYDILSETDKEKRLDASIKIIGTSISITGFISIIFAIVHSKKNIQREIQKGTIELFKEFNGERFRKVRQEAWVIKEKWYNKKITRKSF